MSIHCRLALLNFPAFLLCKAVNTVMWNALSYLHTVIDFETARVRIFYCANRQRLLLSSYKHISKHQCEQTNSQLTSLQDGVHLETFRVYQIAVDEKLVRTLKEIDGFAHYFTEVPQQGHWLGNLHWHAEQGHQEISNRKVHKENVCYAETKIILSLSYFSMMLL